jgi:uncharacterized protein (TIGR02391 family)
MVRATPHPQLTGLIAVVRQRFNLPDWHDCALRSVAEGWSWLERYGLIVNDPGQSSGVHRMLTRRAEAIKNEDDFRAFRKENQTVYDLLDKTTRGKIWPMYVRGDYDIAIAQAFKEVEVTMRSKADLKQSDFGERLIKKFFSRFRLPGTFDENELGKQSAEERVFLGAFGMYRNPATHQPPSIFDASQAGEVLIIASHLLRLVGLTEKVVVGSGVSGARSLPT